MSTFTPKRKTASGVEEVTLPISAVNGLQDAIDETNKKTIDRVSYASLEDPESAASFYDTTASTYIKENGISYNSVLELSADIDGSERAYSFPISTHTPIVAGENVSFEETIDKSMVKVNAYTAMPIIRVGSVTDTAGTMCISEDNPLIFTVEIIDGKLQAGDQVQICTRQLFTYDTGRRRKMRLRKKWFIEITEEIVNDRFIFVPIYESPTTESQRLFKNGAASSGTKTLSPLYIRVRRPVIVNGTEVDGLFSNIVTVWKRYNRETGKIYIK